MYSTVPHMNDNRIQMLVTLVTLFILIINPTNAIINYSTIKYHNHSLLNQTTTLSPLKKSNSIELVKKLIANRQNQTKLFFKSKI